MFDSFMSCQRKWYFTYLVRKFNTGECDSENWNQKEREILWSMPVANISKILTTIFICIWTVSENETK